MNIELAVKWIMSLLTSGTVASTGNSKKAPLLSSPDSKPEVKIVDGYYIWKKGEVFELSPHFSTREMSCKCSHDSCVEQRISKNLIDKLELVRGDIKEPLVITSAYRCSKHQEDIRNSGTSTVVAKKSTHELGDAVDCRPKSGMNPGFELTCSAEFTSIGRAATFLHLDLRSGFRRWKY